jgi:lipopolysaccharide/colanic/teichoic acid biosynthesis glycosyltransferase
MSRKWVLLAFDLSLVALAPFLALALRYDFKPDLEKVGNIVSYACLGVPIAAAIFITTRVHRSSWRHISGPDIARICLANALAIGATIFLAFLSHAVDLIPRSVPLMQWALIVVGMVLMRVCARVRARKRMSNAHNRAAKGIEREGVLIVGRNQIAELYLQCIEALAPSAISIEGILDERLHDIGKGLHNIRVIGHPADLPRILQRFKVHCVEINRVVVTMPLDELCIESRDVLLDLEQRGLLKLDRFFDLFAERLRLDNQRDPSATNEADQVTRKFDNKALDAYGIIPPSATYTSLKRLIDCFFAAVILVLLSPLISLVALLVAFDLGFPIIFWQQRPGFRGVHFRLYKFRTMRPGFDKLDNPLPDEQRLSRIGRLLRRTRLDELPQLYNIIVGEMSFVGPRPLRSTRQPKNGDVRLCVRPGVTGWNQVNGGHAVADHHKLALDVWYLRRASLRLDFEILMRTLLTVVRGDHLSWPAIEAAEREFAIFGRGEDRLALKGPRKVA